MLIFLNMNSSIYYKRKMVICDGWLHCSGCEQNTPCGISKYWSRLICCNSGKQLCKDCIINMKKYYSRTFVCPFCERVFPFKDIN